MTLFMLFFIFIFKLQDTCFVVFGIVKHVVDDEEWWYTAYTCNKSVYPDSDMFFFFCVWKMQQTCNKCCFKVIFVPLIFQFYFVFLFDPLCLLKTFLGIVSRFVFLMNQIQPLLWFLIWYATIIFNKSCANMYDTYQKVFLKSQLCDI